MCGICGVWYFDQNHVVDMDTLRAMTQSLAHRGPDATGFHYEQSVGLGFRRLCIIDPLGSQQPMANESKTVWLICNGEIYNAPQIRRQLTPRHHFETSGDVETILHLYEECGLRLVEQLRGMFAFALWDRSADVMTLAVDRFGKKPLYYLFDSEKLIFASELKAIRRFPGIDLQLDYEALDEYLSSGYISAPRSIFRGIRKITPGQIIQVKRSGIMHSHIYWKPVYAEANAYDKRSIEELAEELRVLLTEAVNLRLQSSVPVGAFLSGGVDSTAVVGLMSNLMNTPVKTFSIGFEESSYDESAYALAVSNYFHTEHNCEVIRPDALKMLPELIAHYDEPFADSSMIPTHLVSKLAHQHVGVVLSGDGGDEVFGGYHQYLYATRQRVVGQFLPKALFPVSKSILSRIPFLKKMVPYLTTQPTQNWLSNGFFSPEQRRRLYRPGVHEHLSSFESEQIKAALFEGVTRLDSVSQLQYYDLLQYLPADILVKVDRASMLHSLEVRCPLLDHVVSEFMCSVPPRYRVGVRSGKLLLKAALKHILPSNVYRRKKQGFSIPQSEWLHSFLLPVLAEPHHLKNLLDETYIQQLVHEHRKGTTDHKDRLWALLCLELWLADLRS